MLNDEKMEDFSVFLSRLISYGSDTARGVIRPANQRFSAAHDVSGSECRKAKLSASPIGLQMPTVALMLLVPTAALVQITLMCYLG